MEPRLSASHLPPEADPAEKEFVGLLAKALAPSYTLIRRLGAGGMGAVYVARDPVLKRLVAVKVMSPELARDKDARTRFEREAQAVAAISHPNVVAVYAVGELENGLPYIVMQYVEGRSFHDRIRDDGPLDVPAAKRVLGEVASALTATHKKGIIHRDIKPANILWDDETGRALVTDFGIAAVKERQDTRDAVKITQTGMAVGTPAYMSPEQFLAEPVTEKTDIYALGLLGYELLLGEGPYKVKSPAELMAAHLRDEPRKLTALRKEVDAELEQLLVSCLAKDATKRPTAEVVAKHLTHGASVLLEWPPPGFEMAPRRFNGAASWLMVGSFLVAGPMLMISALGNYNALREALPGAGARLLVTVVGAMVLGVGAVDLWHLWRLGRRAVSRGFGWFTLFETACDSRGDTGVLIAGGREYAGLSPEQRNSLRARRAASGGLRLIAAITPLLGFWLALPFAARSGNAQMLALGTFGLCAILILASRMLIAIEADRLRKDRDRIARARAARADDAGLGDAWTATFDAVRTGQRLGAGRPSGIWLKPFAIPATVATSVLVIGGGLLLGVVLASVAEISEVAFAQTGFPGGTVTQQARAIERLEQLRLPVDTSLTPLRAGQLMVALSQKRTESQLQSKAIAGFVRSARGGMPKALRDSIVVVASDARVAEFRQFARARTYDFLGASLSLDSLDGLHMTQVPVPAFRMFRSAAHANLAAGFLAVSDGKPAEAELRFRETLTGGFLLIREGNTVIENYTGISLVNRARTALVALYEQTGQSAEAVLLSPSADPEFPIERRLNTELTELRERALQMANDKAQLRGMRTEVLHFGIAYMPCSDLHQVLFGLDDDYTATFKQATAELVRFPSDSVLMLKATKALEKPLRFRADGSHTTITSLRALASLVDFLTGSKRMQSCVSLIG